METKDEQLVDGYLKGDAQALEVLIWRYLKPVYNFSYRRVGNVQEAEDVTQEVFVKVWRNLKKFDRNKSFRAWIFSIAKNTVIDFLRKKKTVSLSEIDAETLAAPVSLADKIESSVLRKLSPVYRAVLSLYCNGHLNFREIAETTGESINTVKSRHRRALLRLKKLL
jgi:RNA polymerase sigma-70 factor, ECF subfamily